MTITNVTLKEFIHHMGHSDVSVTLNVYTHTGYQDAKKELTRLKEAKEELDKSRFITQKHAQTTRESLIS